MACMLCSVIAIAQPVDRPALKDVAIVFFQRYTVNKPFGSNLGFERRPEGYYAIRLEQGDIVQRELFYNFADKTYIALEHFNALSSTDNQYQPEIIDPQHNAEVFLSQYLFTPDFDRQPYYGYRGWYKDVIADYENKKQLSDWELNALGRAYQTAGASLLHDFTTFGLPEEQFPLPDGQPALTPVQINQYIDIHSKRIAAYKRLVEQNPDFMTPVGPVTTKYANEIMDGFLMLLCFQDEATARKVLDTGIYDSFMLQSAQNMLLSCPPDAVLFTWGDSDTYPLLYVQAVEKVRTDVIVANASLMILPRYLSMLYKGPLGAKPLLSRLPSLFFKKLILWENFNWAPDSGKAGAIDLFYEYFADSTKYQAGYKNQFDQISLFAERIEIPVSASARALRGDIPESFYWQKGGESYFFSDHIAQIDILAANNWSRPLCFAFTVKPSVWQNWSPHLAIEGMVYRLYPDELRAASTYATGEMNTEATYRLWTEAYHWDTTAIITDFDKAPYYQGYFSIGRLLSYALLEKGDTAKALEVARSLPVRLPNSLHTWDAQWALVVNLLGDCGDPVLGERIAQVILDNYEKDRSGNSGLETWPDAKKILISFGEKYGYSKLVARCMK